MNDAVLEKISSDTSSAASTRLKVIDCDIHPSLPNRNAILPFLSKRWQEHFLAYGDRRRIHAPRR